MYFSKIAQNILIVQRTLLSPFQLMLRVLAESRSHRDGPVKMSRRGAKLVMVCTEAAEQNLRRAFPEALPSLPR